MKLLVSLCPAIMLGIMGVSLYPMLSQAMHTFHI